MKRLVGEVKKKQCPIGMGSCVKADCEWWCDARCAMKTIADAIAKSAIAGVMVVTDK